MSTLYLREDLGDAVVGRAVELTGPEAKHAATVGRVRAGETVLLGDGAGRIATCTVGRSSGGVVELTVDAVESREERRPLVLLAQALAKGDRDERAVQMATEFGAAGIVPWAAERSVSRWDAAKAAKGVARWQSIAREASKQSIRFHVPVVEPLTDAAGLAARAATGRVLVLDPTATTRLSSLELDDRDIVLVVGPEGGLSPAELSRLEDAGAERVLLGDTVLRTSSAGPAAIAVLNVLTARW